MSVKSAHLAANPGVLAPGRHTGVALSVSAGAVKVAKGVQKHRDAARDQGRALLDDVQLAALADELERLELVPTEDNAARRDALAAAIATQTLVRGRNADGRRIQAGLAASVDTCGRPTPAAVLDALAIQLGGLENAAELFFHAGGLAAQGEARRRRDRLRDHLINEMIRFAGPMKDGRLPVFYIGDWAVSGATTQFAFKDFLKHLARRAIVVMCDEHCTTKLCGDCGSEVKHPHKAGAKAAQEHKGTVYCPNRACASRGRFMNRDVAAASNIVNRFVCGFLVGGQLAGFSRVESRTTDPTRQLSFFGTLAADRRCNSS
jgi:hypothetical protein